VKPSVEVSLTCPKYRPTFCTPDPAGKRHPAANSKPKGRAKGKVKRDFSKGQNLQSSQTKGTSRKIKRAL